MEAEVPVLASIFPSNIELVQQHFVGTPQNLSSSHEMPMSNVLIENPNPGFAFFLAGSGKLCLRKLLLDSVGENSLIFRFPFTF